MKKNYRYYVHRFNGKVTRIARLCNNGAYGWENGEWVRMNGLWKIENDITDFEDITEAEAMQLIEQFESNNHVENKD